MPAMISYGFSQQGALLCEIVYVEKAHKCTYRWRNSHQTIFSEQWYCKYTSVSFNCTSVTYSPALYSWVLFTVQFTDELYFHSTFSTHRKERDVAFIFHMGKKNMWLLILSAGILQGIQQPICSLKAL